MQQQIYWILFSALTCLSHNLNNGKRGSHDLSQRPCVSSPFRQLFPHESLKETERENSMILYLLCQKERQCLNASKVWEVTISQLMFFYSLVLV